MVDTCTDLNKFKVKLWTLMKSNVESYTSWQTTDCAFIHCAWHIQKRNAMLPFAYLLCFDWVSIVCTLKNNKRHTVTCLR